MKRIPILQQAEQLKRLLAEAARSNQEASSLYRGIAPLLDRCIADEFTSTLDWGDIPGDYLFVEGSLRDIPGLEQAFSEFKIQATGNSDSPVLAWLHSEMAARDSQGDK